MSCTHSGKSINLLKIRVGDIKIEDIAVALSRMPRWAGHTKPYKYSVAEHSVYVSKMVPEVLALPALLHDAEEAFTGDIPTPMKKLVPELEEISFRIRMEIWDNFGATATDEDWELIDLADNIALRAEARDLMPHKWLQKAVGPAPKSAPKIRCVVEEQAAASFLTRFNEAMAIWRKRKKAA
jgi:5'-deoxynucleotidase YfbR-like HD superfamily hydrolase